MATNNNVINNNVYAIVNDIARQALGSQALTVTDTSSFVDLGDRVLNSNDYTETFMQSLLLRIARVYYTWRPYESSLKDLLITGDQWAAIYQKIDGAVGDFVSDETFELTDGLSVDQYIVRKPTATQKLFVKRSAYSNYITISRQALKGAFTSEGEFNRFVAMLFGKMRIKLDFATENMARLAIANYIANMHGSSREVHLLTQYNTATGSSVTAAQAYFDKNFLAYAAGQIELYSKRFRTLSTIYNAEGAERHTPKSEQRLLVFDEFQNSLQYTLQWQAYHENLVKLREFIEVPYWQAEQNRSSIYVTGIDESGDTEEIEANNIIAMIFDRYALGTFRSDEETLTTPLNARGRYYNTFHHAEQLWYNDFSENAVYFSLT